MEGLGRILWRHEGLHDTGSTASADLSVVATFAVRENSAANDTWEVKLWRLMLCRGTNLRVINACHPFA